MKRAVFVISLMVCCPLIELRAGESSLYLKPASGDVTWSAAGNSWEQRVSSIREFLERTQSGFDPEDPLARSLAWFYAKWSRVDDGAGKINRKYFNIGVEYYNHALKVSRVLEKSNVPAEFRNAWRETYGRWIIEERLKLSLQQEQDRLAGVPKSSKLAAPKSPAALVDLLQKHYNWAGLSDDDRVKYLAVLCAVNPGIQPAGWFLADSDREIEEDALHVRRKVGDGMVRVHRYDLRAGVPMLLPPGRWLAAQARKSEMPAAPDLAADSDSSVFCVQLEGSLSKDIPLRVYLTRRGKKYLSAWAHTPTVSNRPHDILLTDQQGSMVEISLAVPTGKRQADRLALTLDLAEKDGLLEGTFEGTRRNDDDALSISGKVAGLAVSKALPPTGPLDGSWPWYMGPRDTARGEVKSPRLVENLEFARLAWVSDEPIPTGRGPDTRGKVRPIDFETLSGGWASPVSDGRRVFLSYYVPSGSHYAWGADKKVAEDPTGSDRYRLNLIGADDVVHCFDARTGRTLWKQTFADEGLSWSGFNKSGPEMTPCVVDGRVYAVGTTGNLYCLDAKTGRTLWQNDIGRRARLLRFQRRQLIQRKAHYGSRSDFSTRVVPAGEVVVVCDHVRTKGGDEHYRYELENGMIGYDRQTGRVRWHLREVGSSATRWVHEGKEYLIVAGLGKVRCVQPNTGEVLWQVEGDGNLLPLPARGDKLLCYRGDRNNRGLVCLQISPTGARKAWTSKLVPAGSTPIAVADGHAYFPVAKGPIVCISLEDGRQVGKVDRGAGCSTNVVSGGRMLITPDQSHGKPTVLYIKASPSDFRLLDEWHVPLSAAYTTPLITPLVDGRLLMRFRNRLVCYDLRESSAVKDRPDAPKQGSVTPVSPPKPKTRQKPPDKPELSPDPGPTEPALDPLRL